MRRIGKTSLLYTGLKLLGYSWIVIDCGVFEEKMYISRADMLKVFEESLNKAVRRHRGLVGFLRNVEEVSIHGLTLRLKTSSREPLLYRILESLNQYAEERRTRIVIAFDEAQK